MSAYEKFQEWLNNCPVKIIHYEDLTDTFEVIFEVPLEFKVPLEDAEE
jgi:hypothetical protein